MKDQLIGSNLLWTDEISPTNGRIVREFTFFGSVLASTCAVAVGIVLVVLYFVAFPAFH